MFVWSYGDYYASHCSNIFISHESGQKGKYSNYDTLLKFVQWYGLWVCFLVHHT